MHYIVYKTTNLKNNKIYIGKHQTENIDDGYFGSGKLLTRAIKKYGIENFKREILFQSSSEDEMNAKEKELVTEEFCSRKDTYNICPGGNGGFGYLNTSGLNRHVGTDNWFHKNPEIGQTNGHTKKQYYKEQYLKRNKCCAHCQTPIPYEKRLNKFCSHSCAAALNNVLFPKRSK